MSNQDANQFEIFARVTFAHLASFAVQNVRDTIGIAPTRVTVPGYPFGGLFVESRRREVFGVQWDAIAAATSSTICAGH